MTPRKPDFSDPASVVRAFIHQMHCWEAFMGFLDESAEARYRPDGDCTMHRVEVRLHKLTRQIPPFIVEIYLTKRKRVYTPSGAYRIPPQYNTTHEKVRRVVPKTKSLVIVETDRTSGYFGGIREYVVKKQGGVWLIDSVSATLGTETMKLILV
jgi:hypothetical protein